MDGTDTGDAKVQPGGEREQPQPLPLGGANQKVEESLRRGKELLEQCPFFGEFVNILVEEENLLDGAAGNVQQIIQSLYVGELGVTKENLTTFWVKVLKKVCLNIPKADDDKKKLIVMFVAHCMARHDIKVNLDRELGGSCIPQDIILILYDVTDTFILSRSHQGTRVCGLIFCVGEGRIDYGVTMLQQLNRCYGARFQAEHPFDWMNRQELHFNMHASFKDEHAKQTLQRLKDILYSVKAHCSALVLCIMAYGREGYLQGADGENIPISALDRYVDEEIDWRIPKVVIVQAYQKSASSSPSQPAQPHLPASKVTPNYCRVMKVIQEAGTYQKVFCPQLDPKQREKNFAEVLESFRRVMKYTTPWPSVKGRGMKKTFFLSDGLWWEKSDLHDKVQGLGTEINERSNERWPAGQIQQLP